MSMRRGNRPEIIVKGNNFIGFNLSYDFCYEHEHGIDGLIKMFKIKINDDRASGYITELPKGRYLGDCLEFKDVVVSNENHVILYARAHYKASEIDDWFLECNELYGNSLNNNGFACSWNKEGFAILAKEEHRNYINELYEAFIRKDITFSLGEEVCDKDGLKIYITSKVNK